MDKKREVPSGGSQKRKQPARPAGKDACQHPPYRLRSWLAEDARYERPTLCIGCCACGAVLAGGIN